MFLIPSVFSLVSFSARFIFSLFRIFSTLDFDSYPSSRSFLAPKHFIHAQFCQHAIWSIQHLFASWQNCHFLKRVKPLKFNFLLINEWSDKDEVTLSLGLLWTTSPLLSREQKGFKVWFCTGWTILTSSTSRPLTRLAGITLRKKTIEAIGPS